MSDIWDVIENDESGDPIQVATDPDGIEVFMSRDVWQQHILLRHAEIENFKDLIIKAITEPNKREIEDESRQVIRCYAVIPPERQLGKSSLRVRVVVKYVEPSERNSERTGLISSAYLVRWR